MEQEKSNREEMKEIRKSILLRVDDNSEFEHIIFSTSLNNLEQSKLAEKTKLQNPKIKNKNNSFTFLKTRILLFYKFLYIKINIILIYS